MMGRALLILGWLSTLGLLIAGILGFRVNDASGLGAHLLVGLFSSLLLLFSHSWIMFYLIGTGKAVKSAVVEHGLDAELAESTRQFKSRSYPWLMLAMALVMGTFVVGGGVATRVLSAWIHLTLFAVALLVQLRTLLLEGEVLLANERVMLEVNRQIDRRGRPEGACEPP